MTDNVKTGREQASDPPTPPATDLPPAFDISDADVGTRRFNAYLVQMVEEITGFHLWMSSDGLVYANRIGPVTDLEQREGIKRTLQGYADPKVLVEAIHHQARISQRIAMRDATQI